MPSNQTQDVHQSNASRSIITGVCMSPVIVLGIIGNLFSLMVWTKGKGRKTSTAKYLTALSIADIIVLTTSALEFWINYVLNSYIRAEGRFICKFMYFMSYWSVSFSAWILVGVTVERALSVWIPHRISVACRPMTAIVYIGTMTVLLVLLYLSFLNGVDIVIVNATAVPYTECTVLSTSILYANLYLWILLDLVVNFIAPFGIMLFCNISILIKVISLAKRRNSVFQSSIQPASRDKTSKMLKTVTQRIVLLSVTYCVCNAPLGILNVMLFNKSTIKTESDIRDVDIYRIFFHILMYLNNAVNFLLYCLIGSSFRKEFVSIFSSSSRTSSMR